MGYALCIGDCGGCGRTFSFNPVKVPSIRILGTKEPVCPECIAKANEIRTERGLPPLAIADDAYTACDEAELG